jgi:MFS family permease
MSSGGADPEPTRGRKTAAATIIVAHAIKHIYNSGQTSLIMPEISKGLGLNRAQFGSLATASAIAWWTSTMISGYLGDRFSNRAGRMLAISLGLMGTAYFLAGLAPNYKIMLLVMFLAGIGPSMFHPPAIGELARRYPERRGLVVSLHGVAANVGEVLGAPIVAAFLFFLVWRQIMAGSIVPALLVASAVWVLVPSREPRSEAEVSSLRGYFSSLFGLMRNRVLLVLIASTALRSIGEAAVGGFLTLYMRDDLEYSVGTVTLILSVAQITGVVSLPVMGFLSDRVGRKPVLVVGTGLVMLSALALSVADPGYQLYLVIMVRGAFAFSLHHIFVAAALDSAPGVNQSTVVSLIYGAGFIGTFSPFVAGLISDRYGIQSAFLFGGIVLILPTLLLAYARFPAQPIAQENEPAGSRSTR